MTIRTMTLTALVASVAVATGCSQGSGRSSSASTFGGITGSTAGPVSSGMPTPNRAPAYSFDNYYEPASIPGGTVTALAAASVNTGVFAADAPFSYVSLVEDGQGRQEDKLFFDVVEFGSDGSQTLAATGNRQAPGAGDVWGRDGSGNWNLVLDTDENEAVVAAIGTSAYAAAGSRGASTEVYMRGAGTAGQFMAVATIDSAVPTAAASFDGEVWIGLTRDPSLGGGAFLAHGSGMLFNEVLPPANRVGRGVDQRVTDMLAIATVGSGSTPAYQALAIAIGDFDDLTGEALSGSIVLTNGVQFETVGSFFRDAPTALAFHDDTLYVATAKGALKFRKADGSWEDEATLPLVRSISSLLSNGDDLLIGAAGDLGAVVIRRVGGSGPVLPPPPPAGDLYFVTDIAPLLAASCAACHNGGVPAAETAFPLASPADNAADNTEVQARIDLATPANSLFLLKATNDSSVGAHIGGQVFAPGSAEAVRIQTWIAQGARFEAVAPPPPPVAVKTFNLDVYPLLTSDCMGCHAGGNGGFRVNADQTATYNSALGKINQGSAATSNLLTRPSGQVQSHSLITNWGVGESKYNAVLQWIQDGAQRQ